MNVHDLLIVAALICTGLAAFGVTTKVHLGWVGVTLFLISLLV